MRFEHPEYMDRCLTLAGKGKGLVAPNPLVGAVLVHRGTVISEGWHGRYGGPHAEVHCIQAAIEAGFAGVLPECDLYISLEPCSHFGKTPPCTDLIINKKIPRVFVGCTDPFPRVNGRGIEKLRQAGIEVIQATGELMERCIDMNRAFFTFCTKQRPYVVLKGSQTADGFSGSGTKERLMITHPLSNRLVHQWRSEVAAIMVGTKTALLDDPLLTTREWPGPTPLRIVIDRQLELPSSLRIFNADAPTLVINRIKNEMDAFDLHHGKGISYPKLTPAQDPIAAMLEACYLLGIQSILVEGGPTLLQSFINEGCWDEARIITNTALRTGKGIPAAQLGPATAASSLRLETDVITFYRPG